MKKYVSLTLLFLLIFTLFTNINVFADAPAVKAKSAILASADSGQVLYEKAPDAKAYPDGLTKILTAIVAYEKLGGDKVITIPDLSQYVSSADITMGLQQGESLTVADLIKGMLIKSANDAAYVLALNSGETIEGFAEQMNQKAADLGLKNSHFVNPTGIHDENQYTTASDMLKIYREAYKNSAIIDILNSANVIIPATNLTGERSYWTDNHLISQYKSLDYIDSNINGGKPASSEKGGYSAAVNGSKGDMSVICVVFNSVMDKEKVNHSLTDSAELIKYAFDTYQIKTIVKQDAIVTEAKLKNGRGTKHVLLYASETLTGLIKANDNVDEDVTAEIVLPDKISAPVKKDQVIGKVNYMYDGKLLNSANLIALDNIKVNYLKFIGNGILWFLNLPVVKAIWITAICLFVIYVYLLYKTVKKHKKKAAQKRRRTTTIKDDDWLR